MRIRGINALRTDIYQKREEIIECHEEIKKRQGDIEEKSKKVDEIFAQIEKTYQGSQEKADKLSRINEGNFIFYYVGIWIFRKKINISFLICPQSPWKTFLNLSAIAFNQNKKRN